MTIRQSLHDEHRDFGFPPTDSQNPASGQRLLTPRNWSITSEHRRCPRFTPARLSILRSILSHLRHHLNAAATCRSPASQDAVAVGESLQLKNFRLADVPERERPRERMHELGPAGITNTELLAILLGSGGSGREREKRCRQPAYRVRRLTRT